MNFDAIEGLTNEDIEQLYNNTIEDNTVANCWCRGASFSNQYECSGSCSETSYYGCRGVCRNIGLDWVSNTSQTNSNYWCYTGFRRGEDLCCGGVYQVSRGYLCSP